MLCNLSYGFFTIPFCFSYRSYHIDNEHYDLEKAVKILRSNNRVHPLFAAEITDIPEEDATETCNKTIKFAYIMESREFQEAIIAQGKTIPELKDKCFHTKVNIDERRLPDAPETNDLAEEIERERRILKQ